MEIFVMFAKFFRIFGTKLVKIYDGFVIRDFQGFANVGGRGLY